MSEKQYTYIFGPLISRRLGVSLGIDLIPFKTCSLDCVYCECGATTALTNTRTNYDNTEAIIHELDSYLSNTPPHIDVITFAGSGEPTLNRDLGKIATYLRKKYPHYRQAILTNATTFIYEELHNELLSFDYVLPSVDAFFEKSFQKINRPTPEIKVQDMLSGLKKFSEKYHGMLWVEYFVLPGINDSSEELKNLKEYFQSIHLTRIQLNSMDRPGTCQWVHAASIERLREIEHFFHPLPVEIISRNLKNIVLPSSSHIDIHSIFKTIQRRPLTVEELAILYNMSINEADQIVEQLLENGQIEKTVVNGHFYLKAR